MGLRPDVVGLGDELIERACEGPITTAAAFERGATAQLPKLDSVRGRLA